MKPLIVALSLLMLGRLCQQWPGSVGRVAGAGQLPQAQRRPGAVAEPGR